MRLEAKKKPQSHHTVMVKTVTHILGLKSTEVCGLQSWRCFVHPSLQVSAVQISPGEVQVECHSTGVVHSIKSDIHVRGIYVTKVK